MESTAAVAGAAGGCQTYADEPAGRRQRRASHFRDVTL